MEPTPPATSSPPSFNFSSASLSAAKSVTETTSKDSPFKFGDSTADASPAASVAPTFNFGWTETSAAVTTGMKPPLEATSPLPSFTIGSSSAHAAPPAESVATIFSFGQTTTSAVVTTGMKLSPPATSLTFRSSSVPAAKKVIKTSTTDLPFKFGGNTATALPPPVAPVAATIFGQTATSAALVTTLPVTSFNVVSTPASVSNTERTKTVSPFKFGGSTSAAPSTASIAPTTSNFGAMTSSLWKENGSLSDRLNNLNINMKKSFGYVLKQEKVEEIVVKEEAMTKIEEYEKKSDQAVSKQAKIELEQRLQELKSVGDKIGSALSKSQLKLNSHQNEFKSVLNKYYADEQSLNSKLSKSLTEKDNVLKEKTLNQTKINVLEEKLSKLKEIDMNFAGEIYSLEKDVKEVNSEKISLGKKFKLDNQNVQSEISECDKEIELLKKKLQTNAEQTKAFVNSENVFKLENKEVINEVKPDNSAKLFLEHLTEEIQRIEKDLECPVCFEKADSPIYTCPESHLICKRCQPKIRKCPVCRVEYQRQPKIHRYAEKQRGELSKLLEKKTALLEKTTQVRQKSSGNPVKVEEDKHLGEKVYVDDGVSCPTCTLINKKNASTCRVCGNILEVKTEQSASEKGMISETSNVVSPETNRVPGCHKQVWYGNCNCSGDCTIPYSHQVYVGNIPNYVVEGDLVQLFNRFGNVLKVVILSNSIHPLDFGFVYFNSEEGASNALRNRWDPDFTVSCSETGERHRLYVNERRARETDPLDWAQH